MINYSINRVIIAALSIYLTIIYAYPVWGCRVLEPVLACIRAKEGYTPHRSQSMCYPWLLEKH